MRTWPCPAAPTPTSPTCSPPPRSGRTWCLARVLLPSWPATTRFMPNETAFVPRPPRPASPGTAVGVLASVLDRDGQQASATQTRQQALADADHLAVLH